MIDYLMSSLLDMYILSDNIKSKRENIQRRVAFSEPVSGLSLQRIIENDIIERKKSCTDNTDKIENISELNQDQIKKLNSSGYIRISDIANTDIRQISNEVDLPWNAVKELKNISHGQQGIDFKNNDKTEETISSEKAINRIINNKNWRTLIIIEYTIRTKIDSEIQRILEKSDKYSRKKVIENMHNNKKKAESYAYKISRYLNCSEQYVKDVLSNRIDEGLNNTEREEILERDDFECQICGSNKELEIHHIIPVSSGGTKTKDNLCTLCSQCHLNVAHGGKTSTINYETKEEFWSKIVN